MNSACPIGHPASDRLTILVVEEDILARMALTDELREHGFNVAEAKNAAEALSIFHSGFAVQLAIIDLDTPRTQESVRLASTIRAEYPAVKVLAASGQAPQDDLRETVHAFFIKPYDVGQLVATIQSLLEQ